MPLPSDHMKSFRVVGVAALLCTLGACGGADEASAPSAADAPPATSDAAPAEPSNEDVAAVETAFTDYNQALAAQDSATACSLSSPEAMETLVAAVSQQLGQQVAGCPEAFDLVLTAPGGTELAQQTAATLAVQDVAVQGDTATVTWSAEMPGQPPSALTNDLRRVDGRWLMAGGG